MEQNFHWIQQIQGSARFSQFVQNFSERQILWSLRSVVFHAFALKLPIQTSVSVAPKLPVSLSSHEKMSKFQENVLTPGNLISHWNMNWAQFIDPVSTCVLLALW